MANESTCLKCGAPLTADARDGVCPMCLLGQALAADVAGAASAGSSEMTGEQPVPEVGDRIGRYKLLQKIGEGGCGLVYMAEQEEPVRRRVALKVIKLGMDTREVIARFEAERQALALMDHPNIAKVFDGGATDTGRPYFVMELVRGIRITDFCDQNNYSTRQRLDLFMQACQAVQHAHQKGIIHRDLKPSNILVTINDGVPVPKVIDFGIAKATAQRLTDKTLFTRFHQFIGTPAYMSPEQAEMTSLDIDTRSDIYSLGVLLYELLSGKTPFDSKELLQAGLDEMRRIIREQEPMRPSTRLSTILEAERTTVAKRRGIDAPKLVNLIRGDLDWIVMKCLEKDRARRYETANGLAADIKRHLRQEPVGARPPSVAYRIDKFVRRNRLAVSAAAAVALALVVGTLVSAWQWHKAVVARRAEAEQRERAEQTALAEQQAKAEADQQRDRAEQQAQRAHAALTRAEIDRAESMFAASSTARGVAYLAGLLRQSPTNHVVAERLLRALTVNNFCIPTAPPLSHAQRITCSHFSPDGELVLTTSKDGTARLWSAQTGMAVGEPLRHDAAINWGEFSVDGQHLVTASDDGTCQIWEARSGRPVGTSLRHDGRVLYAAFSPRGERVVTGSSDKTVRFWDLNTGTAIAPTIQITAEVYFACFSPTGTEVLIAVDDGTARIFACADGAELASYPHRRQPESAIPFPQYSPQGDRVLTLQSASAELWTVGASRRSAVHLPHGHNVTSAIFSLDGKRVATASLDNSSRIWDAQTGKMLLRTASHGDHVLAVCFSTDGKLLLTGSEEKSIRTEPFIAQPLRHGSRVTQIRFNPKRQQALAVTYDNEAVLWDIRRGNGGPRLLQHKGEVRYAVFSADGRRIATASRDRTARVWEARTGRAITSPLQQKGWIHVVRFSPDGQRVATVSDKREVQIWDSTTGAALLKPEAEALTAHIFNLQFSPDGHTIALATGGGAWILNSATGDIISHPASTHSVRHIAYSPDGGRVVTSSEAGLAVIWDTVTGSALSGELRHNDIVYWAEFSSDGRKIATASRDKTVRLWDVDTGLMLGKPLLHADSLSINHSLQFSPEGKWIATAAGKAAQIWNLDRPGASALRLEHPSRVTSVRFSPDGKRLITSTAADHAQVWDVGTGHALSAPFRDHDSCYHAEFSPDGEYAVTASVDGAARIWWVPQVPAHSPEWLPDLAEALVGRQMDETGSSVVVGVGELFDVIQRVEAAASNTADFYSEWAKWFLSQVGTNLWQVRSSVGRP